MEYHNELLDAWVGTPVWVIHARGPELNDEDIDRMVQNPTSTTDQQLHSRIALYVLVGYDQGGVILRGNYENSPRFFAPWSAVIRLQGRQEGDVPSSD